METLFFNGCIVKVFPETGYTETRYDDNSFVPAMPNYDPASFFTANDLGYGVNTKLMTIHHEILHTFLAEKIGLPHSPTLWAVAHNFGSGCVPVEKQWEEEALVLSYQKYLNVAEVEPPLENYLETNKLKLRQLKHDSLLLTEGLDELCQT